MPGMEPSKFGPEYDAHMAAIRKIVDEAPLGFRDLPAPAFGQGGTTPEIGRSSIMAWAAEHGPTVGLDHISVLFTEDVQPLVIGVLRNDQA